MIHETFITGAEAPVYHAIIAPLIAGGVALATGIGNWIGGRKNRKETKNANQSQIEHSREMYNLQRKHALADRAHTEQYELPSAQMQRLKEAGLNPHLAYSQGNPGSTVTPAQARVIPPNIRVPDHMTETGAVGQGLTSAIETMLAIKEKQATINNIEANTRNTSAMAFEREFNNQALDGDWLNAIRTAKAYSIADQRQTVINKTMDNMLKQEMQGRDINFEIQELASGLVGKVRTSSVQYGRNLTMEKAEQEVRQLQENINSVLAGTDLKRQQQKINQLELEFNRSVGLPPNSPWFAQAVARMIKAYFGISILNFD